MDDRYNANNMNTTDVDLEPGNAIDEIGDRQHVNPDGQTDAEKAGTIGGVGGAVTGLVAGAMTGPVGAVVGAIVGGAVGAIGSKAAVTQVDKYDNDVIDPNLPPDPENDNYVLNDDHLGQSRPIDVPDSGRGEVVVVPDGRHPLPGDYGYDKAFKDPETPNPFLGEDQDGVRNHPYEPADPVTPTDAPHVEPKSEENPATDREGDSIPSMDRGTRPL